MIDTRRSASTCTALAVDRTGMFINVCLFVIFASLVTYLAYQFFNPPLESDLKVYKDNQVILKCVTDAASNTLIVELIEEGKLQQRFEVDGCERLEPTNKKKLARVYEDTLWALEYNNYQRVTVERVRVQPLFSILAVVLVYLPIAIIFYKYRRIPI